MEVNEEKRQKFIEYAGKRVNNVMHDIQILEPMSRSNSYDFTKQDLEEMFTAMQECLNATKEEFYKKFEEKEAKSARKTFTFGASNTVATTATAPVEATANNWGAEEQVVNTNETINTNIEGTTTEL
ncbi:MAG: hypothetical protein IJH12_09000 [Clostridia bacterium]|nr:hypothetical protein [Clostridia bacterium]